MLITGFAALLMMAATAPARRSTDCIAMPIPMAWHAGALARRDLRIDQGWRPRARCFRLAAR